ncbi:hypothetical protein MCECM63_01566 [Methylophilaceae bacterium]
MYQENVLTYKNFRYLKWSFVLIAICISAYIIDTPPIRQGGGTWLGYTLGSVGAIIIFWLMFFGLRKRAYKSNLGSVRGWLSAHVYLGLSLIVVATLHAAFHFGWNIHTLSYILTIAVVLSGLWGIVIYLRNPILMSNLLNGKTLGQCGEALLEIDAQSIKIAKNFSPTIQELIVSSAEGPVFEHFWNRYFGKHPQCMTTKAVILLTEQYSQIKTQTQDLYTGAVNPSEANTKSGATLNLPALQEELFTLQLRRQLQLGQIREYLRLKGWAEVWLIFHVPLSFGLLAALVAHIFSVFFYW